MPKRKKDWAEKQTDKRIEELEEEIYKEYKEAYENVKKKYDEYSKKFLEDDAKKKKQLADGEITEDDYKKWKTQKLLVGSRWKALETNLAQDLTMVDKKVMSIVNGYLPEAYALNFNYSTYELEEGINIDTSFTLYSRETVERLFREGEIELPKGKVDIPEDMKWNKKHITSAIMQGILSGDDIPTIGERLRQVTDMDRRGAIRNARTLMTGAQNSGRIDAYGRIADMGVEVKKQWLATLDRRTRDSHQELDGQIVDLDKKFSNGLLYPGDPNGAGEEVYNCRCTLIPYYPEYEDINVVRYDQLNRKDIKYQTYSEWAGQHRTIGKNQIVKIENEITEQAKQWGIEYHEPKPMHRSEEEIIRDVGGGDLTQGSCASLSFCYAGNKAGYDVLDFRGGTSQNFFSKSSNINKIAQFDGVKSIIIKAFNDFDAVKELLKNVIEGKEYILSTGQHAAVIRKIGEKYQYLELQSSKNNGFKDFQSDTLKNRFGCKRSHTSYGYKLSLPNTLIGVDSLMASDDFKAILGYINTPEEEQKKGVWGYAK